MIELQSVVKKDKSGAGLNGITAQFEPGLNLLMGGPGSGKSLLLKLVLGVVRPDQGRVQRAGEAISPAGYVAPNGLFPHMTVEANAVLPARVSGWDRDECSRRVSAVADELRLGSLVLKRTPRELSPAETFQANLLRSLVVDPVLLCLDDPLRDLGPVEREAFRRVVPSLVSRPGRTVLWATRDAGDAAASGGLISFLHEGKILQRGSWNDLETKPAHPIIETYLNAFRAPFLAPNPS